MGDCRAYRLGIWDLDILVEHTWDTFELVVVKVILGSFNAFVVKLVFEHLCNVSITIAITVGK